MLCLDAARGEVLWKKDLVKDFNASIPRYGARGCRGRPR